MAKTGFNGNVQEHGVAKHTNVARYKFFPAKYQEFDDPAIANSNNYRGIRMLANEDAGTRHTINIPSDFVSILTIHPVVLCEGASGNISHAANSQYGASGQPFNTHTGNYAQTTVAVVQNQTDELPDLGILTLAAKNDYVGIYWVRWGTVGADTAGNILLLGFMLRYMAEQ